MLLDDTLLLFIPGSLLILFITVGYYFLGVLALLLMLHAGTSLVKSQVRWSPWLRGSNVVLPSLVALPPC